MLLDGKIQKETKRLLQYRLPPDPGRTTPSIRPDVIYGRHSGTHTPSGSLSAAEWKASKQRVSVFRGNTTQVLTRFGRIFGREVEGEAQAPMTQKTETCV
jgi:hypothetical protein